MLLYFIHERNRSRFVDESAMDLQRSTCADFDMKIEEWLCGETQAERVEPVADHLDPPNSPDSFTTLIRPANQRHPDTPFSNRAYIVSPLSSRYDLVSAYISPLVRSASDSDSPFPISGPVRAALEPEKWPFEAPDPKTLCRIIDGNPREIAI
jgi:hypothetical protein